MTVNLQRLDSYFGWEDKDELDEINEEDNNSISIGQIQIVEGQFSWNNKFAFDYDLQCKEIFKSQQQKAKESAEKKKQAHAKGGMFDKVNKIEAEKLKEDLTIASKQNEESQLQDINNEQLQGMTILKDINIKVEQGMLIGVIGKVGSGKSSLINAMVNEMHLEKGKIRLNKKSSISLVSQTAWLMNDTLRNNILFGSDFEAEKYQECLRLCELNQDIEQFQGGDMTEIGERGINLSGGQKQRVSLARAVYADTDIYIIDDCFSALDNYVATKIFNNLILAKLKNKTRIFVTHALQYLPHLSYIYVMKHGTITQQGTYSQLTSQNAGEFYQLIQQLEKKESPTQQDKLNISDISIPDENENGQSKPQIQSNVSTINQINNDKLKIQSSEFKIKNNDKETEQLNSNNKDIGNKHVDIVLDKQKDKLQNDKKTEQGKLINEEKKESGSVKMEVYMYYFSQAGGMSIVLLILFFIISQGFLVFSDIWLGFWSSNTFKQGVGFYLVGYLIVGVVTSLAIVGKGLVFGLFIIKTAINMQGQLMQMIFKSTMSWFDITPSGRILSRTNKDQDDIDITLPWTLNFCFTNIFSIIGYIVTVSAIIPLFIVVFLLILLVFVIAVLKYIKVAREVKRLESLKRAPALSLIGETANGCITIRVYGRQNVYMKMVEERFNWYLKANSNTNNLNRWISMYSDLFSCILIGSVSIFAVVSTKINYTNNSAFMGVALTNIFKITGLLSFTIKIMSDTELQMNAVERVKQYINKDELEPEWLSPKIEDHHPNIDAENWPSKGQISCTNLRYQYREDTPVIIKDISFNINSCEKVGVVGRTGSGKSTLTLALLRILEAKEIKEIDINSSNKNDKIGKIIIDGVDISLIGLHLLRQKISIIPQDPFLFTGTLKSNVDPFGQYKSEEIIQSLIKSTIWDQIKGDDIKNDEDKLNFKIQDGGSNFSLGQRQLICMSRSILRKSRILIMDEATASIDESTDRLIQKMIKSEFANTTVITIAHRVNTIIDYDRILVLDQGKLLQFDTPFNLITNQGLFKSIVMESGQLYYDQLLSQISNKNI